MHNILIFLANIHITHFDYRDFELEKSITPSEQKVKKHPPSTKCSMDASQNLYRLRAIKSSILQRDTPPQYAPHTPHTPHMGASCNTPLYAPRAWRSPPESA